MPSPNTDLAYYVGGSGYYTGCNGPSLSAGSGSGTAIESWGAENVDWIRPAQYQSQVKTNIYTKYQSIRDVINTLQSCFDTIQSYGSAFATDTSLFEAIGILGSVQVKLQHLGNIRMDTLITQYNNNIEFYRVKKIKEEINQAVHDYNNRASAAIRNYTTNWPYYHPYNEETYGSEYEYEQAFSSDCYWYRQDNFPAYPIRTCDHGETTLSALRNCPTLRKVNNVGSCIVFEDRPSDTYC